MSDAVDVILQTYLRPILSLTELQGSIDSSLARIVAPHPSVTRFSFTRGV